MFDDLPLNLVRLVARPRARRGARLRGAARTLLHARRDRGRGLFERHAAAAQLDPRHRRRHHRRACAGTRWRARPDALDLSRRAAGMGRAHPRRLPVRHRHGAQRHLRLRHAAPARRRRSQGADQLPRHRHHRDDDLARLGRDRAYFRHRSAHAAIAEGLFAAPAGNGGPQRRKRIMARHCNRCCDRGRRIQPSRLPHDLSFCCDRRRYRRADRRRLVGDRDRGLRLVRYAPDRVLHLRRSARRDALLLRCSRPR